MAIYFFDKNQTLIKIAPDSATFEAIQTQELDDDSLLKDTLSVTIKGDEKLLNAEYMAVKSYTGNAQTFDMYRIVTDTTPDKSMSFTGMSLAPYELNGHILQDLRPTNQTISYVLNRVLDGTDWRVGYIEDGLSNVTTTFYYVSVKEALKELQSLVGCEFVFKVEISGQKITDKWIEVYSEMGNRTKKRFNYGTNALTVVRETNKADIYTALIGRGKGVEVSSSEDNDSGQAGYGRKITFEDIEWSTAKGNPLNKPIGQYYLELPQATQAYGIKNIDGTMKARVGIVDFDDEEDKNRLINLTYQQLLISSRPKVLFKTTVANIGATGIGDTVTIHRHDLNIHYQTRVRKIVRNKLNDNKTQIELGDAVVTPSTKQAKQNNATIKNLNQEIEKVKADVNTSQTSADGKNTIFYGPAEPTRQRTGDTWYRPHPSISGERQMLVWNGDTWELVIDTSDLTSISREVQDAISKAEEAKGLAVSEAEGALSLAKADATAKANAVKTEVSNSVNTAINTANDAKDTAASNYTNAVAEAKRLDGEQKIAFDKRFDTIKNSVDTASQSASDADAKAKSAIEKAGANANLLDTHQNTINTISDDLKNLKIGGENLIIRNTLQIGYYISSNGSVVYGGGIADVTTDWIDISGEKELTFTTYDRFEGVFTGRVALYSDKSESNFISLPVEYNSSSPIQSYTFDVPENAKYARVSVVYGETLRYKLEKGNVSTDWSLALEDMLGKADFQVFKTTYEANDKLIKSRLLAVDSGKEGSIAYRLNETESTADGNAQTIANIKTKPGEQIADYQTIKVRSDLYERVIGSSNEATVKQNMARIIMTDSIFQTEVVDKQSLISGAASGTGMTKDPYFDKGINDLRVYDNGNTGTITVRRTKIPSDTSFPPPKGTDGYRVDIVHAPSTATSPDRGGVFNLTNGWTGGTVVVRFVALLPTGRSFNYHNNNLGTGFTSGWLTDNKGTGKWETYMYYYRFGAGAVSTFGFLSVTGASTGFTWHLSDYDIINVNETSASKITQLQDNINLKVSKEGLISQFNLSADNALIQVGTNKLNVTPDTTFIQDATIKSAMIDTIDVKKITGIEADFTIMVTKGLTANVISSTMINANEAMFTKLFATKLATDKLVAQGAWITNANIVSLDAGKINAGEIDTGRIKSGEVVAKGLVADVVKSTHIESSVGLIDKIFAQDAYITRLTGKTAFISSIQAIDISASKITTGELDGSKAAITNIDANNITANKTDFIKTNWNAINAYTQVDANGVQMLGSGTWRRTFLSPTGFRMFNGLGGNNKAGAIGYFKTSQELEGLANPRNEDFMWQNQLRHTIGIGVNESHLLSLGFQNPGANSQDGYNPAITIDPQAYGRITNSTYTEFRAEARFHESLSFSGKDHFRMYNGLYLNTDYFTIKAETGVRIFRGEDQKILFGGNVQLHTNIDMNGNTISNQSDERLKKNIETLRSNDFEKLMSVRMISYEWEDPNKQQGVHIGFSAQELQKVYPELILEGEDGYLGIDSNGLAMAHMNAFKQHASQTNDEISKLKAQIASLQDELALLKGA